MNRQFTRQKRTSKQMKRAFTANIIQFSSVAQSCLTLWPHGLQHNRLPCPSPTPKACSNSHPASQWCHPTISSSVVLPPSVFPSIRVFSNESVLHIRCPKYWNFSFSIGPSNEYSGLISFRMDWLDLLAVQGTLKSLLQHHSSKASILWHWVFFTVQLLQTLENCKFKQWNAIFHQCLTNVKSSDNTQQHGETYSFFLKNNLVMTIEI